MEEGSRIRVLVIDHSAFARAALPKLVEADPELEVVGVAKDGEEGLKLIQAQDPDVVLMALGLQPVDTITLLKRWMSQSPRPVIALMPPGVEPLEHLRALEAGAVTGLTWEVEDDPASLMAMQSLLASKIKTFGAVRSKAPEQLPTSDRPTGPLPWNRPAQERVEEPDVEVLSEELPARPRSPLAMANRSSGLIQPRRILAAGVQDPDRRAEVGVLGAGAGGPAALRKIVTQLPPNLNIALLALVRMPEDLLHTFAERLDRDSAIRVLVAQEGDPVRPGVLLLAPAGKNVGMVRTGRKPKALVRLIDPDPGVAFVPSFDVTFRACAAIYGPGAMGLILSGLSRDGLAGLQAIKAKGGMTAVLDFQSAIVSTTNQICVEAGASDEVLDPLSIITSITRLGLPF